LLPGQFQGQRQGAGTEIEHRAVWEPAELPGCFPAPVPVDLKGEQGVEQVVAGAYRGKFVADEFLFFFRLLHNFILFYSDQLPGN
jgi:hypothetical protein